jgi:hypothetical protein
MKTIKKIYSLWLVAAVLFASGLSSCHEGGIEMGDETGSLDHLFRPAVFVAENVGNTTTVSLSWGAVTGAQSYTLEIYSGEELDFTPAKLVHSDLVTDIKYSVELAGDSGYSARVKANPDDPTRDSHWDTVTFTTPAENIFFGFDSDMSGRGSATVNWLPGMTVTTLVFTTGGTPQEFAISAAESAAGSKTVTGLENATYQVDILNGEINRGRFEGLLIEGDVFLAAGDDFEAAFAAASPGQVIVLAEGASYPLRTKGAALGSTEGFRIDKDITVRGVNKSNRPTLYPETNFGTAVLDFGATLADVTFKNVRISGVRGDNGATSTYFVNQKDAATIGNLSFINCEIDGCNGGMRFQNPGPHAITNFTFDGCEIHDMGTGYSMIHIQNGHADNIKVVNTTLSSFGYGLLLHNAASSASVVISDCTFYNYKGASNRYLVEYSANHGVTSGITLRNCIFALNATPARGFNSNDATTITAEGNYRTNDWDDSGAGGTAPVTTLSTLYDVASDALFTAPAEGDLSIKDTAFPGLGKVGDPRWY